MEAIDESRKALQKKQRGPATAFPEAQGDLLDAELDPHPSHSHAGGRTEALIDLLAQQHPERIAGELVIPARAARHADFPVDLDRKSVV